MNLGELIAYARIRLRDKKEDYLWPDDDLTFFYNNAVEEAIVRARFTQRPIQIVTTVAVNQYTIPYSVLLPEHGLFIDQSGFTLTAGTFILGKWYTIKTLGTTDFTLCGAATNTVGTVFRATTIGAGTGTAVEGQQYPISYLDQNEVFKSAAMGATSLGVPAWFSRAQLDNTIQLYPTPMVAGTVLLDIRRIPQDTERMKAMTDTPMGIPVEFHRFLIDWVLYEAYLIDDSDQRNDAKAANHLNAFTNSFGLRPSARAEVQARRHPVGSEMIVKPFGGLSDTVADPFFGVQR